MATDDQKFIIWFAGFYEGEGSISNDKGNRNRLLICVPQNDPTPLYEAKEKWGGYVTKRVRKSPASDKICTGYEWRIKTQKAEAFLKDIEPYLRIPFKIDQIKTARDVLAQPWEGNFECHFCDNTYKDPSGRRRHELKEHINKGAVFKCEKCDRTYKSRDSMKRHMRINHKPDASESDDESENDSE